jgi:uroporphyrinogen-III synthase
MNEQELANLTDEELSRKLTDCRITLESIRPYRDKATSLKQQQLWAEVKRREQLKKNQG